MKALKHFQDAYKLNPALIESLESARSVYWGLGKLNMVQKLLELELKAGGNTSRASELLVELGDVLCDQGDWEKAAATYARALGASGGKNPEASGCLEDVQVDAGTARAHLQGLVLAASEASDSEVKARALLRATRVARRFAPEEAEGLLARAYTANPADKQIAALYEGLLAEQGRFDTLEQTQGQALQQAPGAKARAAMALTFGTRWVLRHQNLEVGTRFLEEALRLDPQNEGAFFFLREAYGKKAGDWTRVLDLAEEAATRVENGDSTFLLAQAGTIAWRQLGNLIRARLSFERLSVVSPEHPQLRAFEAQIGETLKPVPAAADVPMPRAPAAHAPPAASAPVAAPPREVTPAPAPVQAAAPREITPPPAPVVAAPPPPAPVEAEPPPPAPAVAVDVAKIAELRQLAEKQEAAKRYNEYVKTLLQLAALVPEPDEKVALYSKAADLYITKFANQAEAVKAYESVLAIDPDNAQAVEYLRQMYEKRRDWEKLLGLQRREAERMPRGASARGEVPRDREARDRAREEARGLHRPVARGPRQRRGERRRARRARGALRARQGLREAGERARAAGRGHLRRAREDPGPHEAGHDLRRAAQQRRGRRQRVAQLLDARPERSARAGRAQEEVPRPRPLGRPRGLLRRERQVGRVHPRPRAARGEGDQHSAEDLPALQDRPALG